MASDQPQEKKRRLSFGRMFGKRDKDSHNSQNTSDVQPSSTSNVADSAYASSENERKPSSDMVHMKNDGQFDGVNANRNLAMNKTTGDVMDEDTGEVVSTVTTTTTTTVRLRLVEISNGR